MATVDTGNLNFFTDKNGHNQNGQIQLTGTTNNDGSFNGAATLTYTKPNSTNTQTVSVNFGNTTTAPYTGTCTMSQPLNIPGFGNFDGGTVTYDPNATKILDGDFTDSGVAGDPEDLPWDAEAGTGVPLTAKKGSGY